MSRPLNRVAAEIDVAFKDIKRNQNPTPGYVTHCRPYIDAMLSMKSFRDFYGIDTGDDIGKRFLANAQSWRGDTARRLKAEIKQLLEEANAHDSR